MSTRDLARLMLRIEANTAGIKRELTALERDTARSGTRMSRALDTTTRAGKRMAASLFSARTAAAALAGTAGLAFATRRAIQFADAIGKTADRIGIGTEALQEWRHAAELQGIAVASLDNGLEAFSKRLGELQAGTGSLFTILRRTDEAFLKQVQSARTVDEALTLILNRMGSLERQQDRVALSAAAFGRTAGVEMANLVRDGADQLSRLRQEARDLGIVLSDETVRRAEKANDELTRMGNVLQATGTQAALEFMPVMKSVAELFTDPAFLAGVRALSENMSSFVGSMRDLDRESVAAVAGLLAAMVTPGGPLVKGLAGGAAGLTAFGALEPRLEKLRREIEFLERTRERLETEGMPSAGRDMSAAVERSLENLDRQIAARRAEMEGLLAQQLVDDPALLDRGGGPAPPGLIPPGQAETGGGTMSAADKLQLLDLRARYDDAILRQKRLTDAAVAFRDEMAKQARQMRQENRTALEVFNEEMETARRLYRAGHLSAEDFRRQQERLRRELERMDPTMRDLKSAADAFGSAMASGLEDILFAADGASASIDKLGESIARMLFRAAVAQPVEGLLSQLAGSLLGGLLGPSAVAPGGTGPHPPATRSQHGNVFEGGAVRRFQRGGIPDIGNEPASFRLANGGVGTLREGRRFEGIFPLTRIGGDLGVKAVGMGGGGGVVNLTIINKTGGEVATEERRRGDGGIDLLAVIDKATARNIRGSGSATRKALTTAFGARPQLAGR